MTEYNINKQGEKKYTQEDLNNVLRKLLSPTGCPWDRAQTHMTLRSTMIEEAYEAVDAIDSGNNDLIVEELGDVLLQVSMHSMMAERDLEFTFEDITDAITRKMITRHTHIFGGDEASSSEEVLKLWEKNKRKEKNQKTVSQSLKEIPKNFTSLMRAEKIQKKASKVGFDWPDAKGAKEKIFEELNEVEEILEKEGKPINKKINQKDDEELYSRVEEEIGDLLFSCVNYARIMGIDSELAIAKASAKFMDRFEKVETKVSETGNSMENMSLEELDIFWEDAKRSLNNES